MKRYDRNILFSVIAVVFLLASLLPCGTEARPAALKMSCTKDSKSYWLRHACLDGFVVNVNGRVLAQADGLDQHDSRVEIMKETCKDVGSGLFGPIKTRLYFPSTKKFICFTPKGQIRTVSRPRANKMGNLCSFYENPVAESSHPGGEAKAYVNLQSAANANWYLGFGPQRSSHGGHRGRALTPEGYEVLLPRKMAPKVSASSSTPRKIGKDKCDFKFSTGLYTPNNFQEEWSGLYEVLELEKFEAARIRALEKNSISNEPLRGNRREEEEEDDFDKKLVDRNQNYLRNDVSSSTYRTKATIRSESEKISAASSEVNDDENDVPPLPSPLALRRRKTRKFRRKETTSYFYDHNRRRGVDKKSTETKSDKNKTPLFSSLL